MADRLQDFRPGQRIPGFPSENANAWNDAARRTDLMRPQTDKTKTAPRIAGVIDAVAADSSAVNQGDGLIITDFGVDPAVDEDLFYNQTRIEVGPSETAPAEEFTPVNSAIMQEPLGGTSAKAASACVSGVTPARVTILETSDRFAIPTDEGLLKSAPFGPIEIIWPDAPITAGVTDCLVRMSNNIYTHSPFLIRLLTEVSAGRYTFEPAGTTGTLVEGYAAKLGFDPDEYGDAYEINGATRITLDGDSLVKAWVAVDTYGVVYEPSAYKLVFSSDIGDASAPTSLLCITSPNSLTAHADTWAIGSPVAAKYGVKFQANRGPLWDSTTHKLNSFYRVPTYDSRGKLVAVSAETLIQITFDPCETP